MKYSLIIHANGPESKDYNVYLTDVSDYRVDGSWWRLGMLQNVSFEASSDSFFPKLHGGFIGLTIKECSKPNLIEGINVFISDFALINENIKIPNVFIRKDDKVLGFIQEVKLSVDVNGLASLYLETYDTAPFLRLIEVPNWVDLKLVSINGEKDKSNG